jgi:hypothetical protein
MAIPFPSGGLTMFARRNLGWVLLGLLVFVPALLAAAEIHSGRVLAVGATSITIRDERDMEDEKILVTAETKITRNGKPAKVSDLGIGDKAKVDANEAGGKLTAKSIEAFSAE